MRTRKTGLTPLAGTNSGCDIGTNLRRRFVGDVDAIDFLDADDRGRGNLAELDANVGALGARWSIRGGDGGGRLESALAEEIDHRQGVLARTGGRVGRGARAIGAEVVAVAVDMRTEGTVEPMAPVAAALGYLAGERPVRMSMEAGSVLVRTARRCRAGARRWAVSGGPRRRGPRPRRRSSRRRDRGCHGRRARRGRAGRRG